MFCYNPEMSNFTIEEICRRFKLVPHPEGGFYRETYRCGFLVPHTQIDSEQRAASTAIYYLLTPDTFSELHSLTHDEIFHFYLGDSVEMLLLHQNGESEICTLGQNIVNDEHLQLVIKAGCIFGCRLKAGGKFALMGTTVAPGFDFADYKQGDRQELIERFPEQKGMILALTRIS